MNIDNRWLIGIGAGVVGLLLGLVIGGSGRSELEARLGQQEEIASGVAALSERVGELDGRIGGVEQALAGFRDEHSGAIERLTQRLEGMGTSLGGAVTDVGSKVSEALSGDLDEIKSQVAGLAERAAARVEQAAIAVAPSGEGTAVDVADTATLGDGKLRVFLSGVDPEAGTARVAINGTALTVLKMSVPVEAEDCTVTLTGIGEGGATINAAC